MCLKTPFSCAKGASVLSRARERSKAREARDSALLSLSSAEGVREERRTGVNTEGASVKKTKKRKDKNL